MSINWCTQSGLSRVPQSTLWSKRRPSAATAEPVLTAVQLSPARLQAACALPVELLVPLGRRCQH
jgi:hypothetical protein